MKNILGFTLTEMMIAVAILAILLAVGTPSFQVFIENSKIRSTAESLQTGLHLARTEAMRRNARVTLWLVNGLSAACVRSNTGTSWVVSQDNPAGSCNVASSETASPRLIQSYAGSDSSANLNVTATDSTDTATNCITFNGFGRAELSCTGGGNPISRISISSASLPNTRRLDIRIPAGGGARMCDPSLPTSNTAGC